MWKIKMKCPICGKYRYIKDIHKYHIQYYPEEIILACKYCNKIEHDLRHGIIKKLTKRHRQVLIFQYKHMIPVIFFYYYPVVYKDLEKNILIYKNSEKWIKKREKQQI